MDPIFPHFSSWMGTLHSLYQSLPLDPSLPLAPCSGWRTLNGSYLADGQRVIVLKHTSIERFDIVVAKEVENGKTKQIVKRIIGMPGDTITYQNDKLTINGKEVKEEYLKEFHAAFAKDKLQKSTPTATTSNNWLRNQRPSLSMLTKTLLFLSLFLKANISYSEITVSFQKIAAKLVTLTRVLLSGSQIPLLATW